MNEMLETLGRNAKEAEIVLRNLDTAKKNQVLEAVADSLVADSKALLTANAIDVENGRKNQMPEGLVDRLMFDRSQNFNGNRRNIRKRDDRNPGGIDEKLCSRYGRYFGCGSL